MPRNEQVAKDFKIFKKQNLNEQVTKNSNKQAAAKDSNEKPFKKLDKLTYVDQAKEVIENMDKDRYDKICLTKNKIRKILSFINELYSMAKNTNEDELKEDILEHIQYVKIHLIYEAGREKTVKEFLNKSELIKHIDSIGKSKEALMLVCHYSEALVAYHRFITTEQ